MIQKERRNYYYKVFILGAVLASVWCIKLIFQSTSSTAAIGFLFVPFYGALAGLAAMGCLYVYFTISDLVSKKISLSSSPVFTSLVFIGLMLYFVTGAYLKQNALSRASDPLTQGEELDKLYAQHLPWGKEEVLALIAVNLNSSPELLEKLSDNPNEYVVSMVGSNPNTPMSVLEKISERPLSYNVHSGLALNPKINDKIIERLISVNQSDFVGATEYRLYQTYVLAALARKKDLSQKYFDILATWPQAEYFLATAVLNSDHVSCEQIRPYMVEGTQQTLLGLAHTQFEKHHCK